MASECGWKTRRDAYREYLEPAEKIVSQAAGECRALTAPELAKLSELRVEGERLLARALEIEQRSNTLIASYRPEPQAR
jgi:hypothetical protein